MQENLNKWITPFFFFSLIWLLSACDLSNTNNITLAVDTVYLNTGDELIAELIHWQYLEDDGEEFLMAYDFMLHKIVIFSLSDLKVVKTVKLYDEGPHEVDVLGLKAVGLDKFIISNRAWVYVVDAGGRVTKRLSLLNSTYSIKAYDPEHETIHNGYIRDAYDEKRNWLYVFFKKGGFKKDGEARLFGAIDLTYDSLIRFDIDYPDFFYQGKSYRTKSYPNITRVEKGLLYNFPATSNIYLFDLSENTTKRFEVPSDYTANVSAPFDGDLSQPYLKKLFFRQVSYDEKNDRYYAIHFALRNEDSVPTIFLRVFDHDFTKISEFNLGPQVRPIPIYWNNKLLLPPRYPEKESPVELIRYTIN